MFFLHQSPRQFGKEIPSVRMALSLQPATRYVSKEMEKLFWDVDDDVLLSKRQWISLAQRSRDVSEVNSVLKLTTIARFGVVFFLSYFHFC